MSRSGGLVLGCEQGGATKKKAPGGWGQNVTLTVAPRNGKATVKAYPDCGDGAMRGDGRDGSRILAGRAAGMS